MASPSVRGSADYVIIADQMSTNRLLQQGKKKTLAVSSYFVFWIGKWQMSLLGSPESRMWILVCLLFYCQASGRSAQFQETRSSPDLCESLFQLLDTDQNPEMIATIYLLAAWFHDISKLSRKAYPQDKTRIDGWLEIPLIALRWNKSWRFANIQPKAPNRNGVCA